MSAWTTEKPTTPGWYWLRVSPLDHNPMIVKVCRAGMGMMGLWTIGKQEMIIIGHGGEWQLVEPAKE